MVRKAKGKRAGTRRLLRKKEARRLTINDAIKHLETGQLVAIKLNPSIQKGMPHVRFHGRTGRIVERRGNAYVVELRDGKKVKRVLSRPEHLLVLK